MSTLFETLESRHLLSAMMDGGDLVLTGTNERDVIYVLPGEQPGEVSVWGVDGVANGELFTGVDSVRIKLRQGNDRAEVGALRDTDNIPMTVRMFGGYGWDKMIGAANTADIFKGGPGRDVLIGNDNNDVLRGGSQLDAIYAGDGNDLVTGNLGRDFVFGEGGNDVIYGGWGNDLLVGGGGNDVISGQLGFDVIRGDGGNDQLFGGGHADVIRGGSGNDLLVGGWGNDDLFGGLDDDELIGGLGVDFFRARVSERQDFNAADAFYNTSLSDQSIGQLDSEYWDEIEAYLAQNDISDDMWFVIHSSQTLLAECGHYLEDAQIAFDSLTEQELQQIAIDALPLFEDLFEEINGDLNADSIDAIMNIFQQFVELLPQDVQVPVEAAFDCMTEHQALIDSMIEAMERIEQETDAPTVLWEGLGAVAIGAIGT